MVENNLSFEEIESSISDNEMMAPYAKYLDPAIAEIEKNNKILTDCMNIVQKNDLGKNILIGANYKDIVEKDVFENADRKCKEASKKYLNSQHNSEIKDGELSFAVERIFVGQAGRVDGGHCGFISSIKGDKNPENAHGEIYINENFVKNVVSNLGEKDGCIYLSNVVVHEFLHANQRKYMINEVQDSRSGLGKPRNKQNSTLTAEEQQDLYNDIQKNKYGYGRNILTEAASMTAGLTVCMQLCEQAENKSKIIDFALEDVGDVGNVSVKYIGNLREILNRTPQSKEEQQRLSMKMFELLVIGEMEYLREKCGKTSLDIKLSDYDKLIDTVHHKDLFGTRDELKQTIMKIDSVTNVRNVCRDIYHSSIGGILSKEDTGSLENMFMQTTVAYKGHEPQEISNQTNFGKNVERLQNIIRNLWKGKYPANQEIKSFLLEKGYITENNGQIEFSPSFILQTPDNGLTGGYTKSDKDGNILIVINQQLAQRSDSSLAVALGHEICHQMINDKLSKNETSAEIEALCDIVGLVASKGAGYDIRSKIAEDEKDFSRETQKKIYECYYPDKSPEAIEKMVDEHMKNIVDAFYMPKKLKQIAEFVDTKIPINNGIKQQNIISEKLRDVRAKLELRVFAKVPYKSQAITINPNTLHLCRSKKQNI